MPNPENRTGRDFSMYDAMDDEQLRQILRDDASKLEGEDTDMELMLHIMEVLAKRRKEAAQEIPPEEALERFNEIYKHTDNSLISEERPAKPKRTFNRWQRWVATAAAVLILIFGTSLTAHALGFDIWEIFVKWTQETFHFSSSTNAGNENNPEKEDSIINSEFQKVLNDYNITGNLLPTYLPEGYTETEVKVKESPKQRVFTAKYEHGENTIRIRISDYLDGYPSQIEQSDSLLEVYEIGDRAYYIFDNNGMLQAAWIYQNLECYVSGPLTLSELKEIINSI